MKALTMKQLDENDEEIADTLISLGMNRPIARTLSLLQNLNEATSVDLERGAGLHQPEVSIAMREIKGTWLDRREGREEDRQGKTL